MGLKARDPKAKTKKENAGTIPEKNGKERTGDGYKKSTDEP